MSSKKIIRLKTPQRPYDSKKSPEHASPSVSQYHADETIMKTKNNQAQNVHAALIAELNKAYAEIQFFKQRLFQEEDLRNELINQNRLLKSRLEMLERECDLQKEKFLLERDNHERLRRFYQQREKEWICILLEHRRLLEQYGNRNEFNQQIMSKKIREQTECGSMATSKSTQQALTKRNNFFQTQDGFGHNMETIKENVNTNKKFEKKQSKQKTGEGYYERVVQRLEDEDTKCVNNLPNSYLEGISEGDDGKLFSHDEETQEIFDKLVRLTFLKFRQQGLRLLEIQQSEDMVKLKKAKTSTKDRLTKTLKKLNFQFQHQDEIHKFCGFVQKCVKDQYQQFEGCYVFDFIMQRLYECQKMAVTSNSLIDKLLRLEQSKVSALIEQKIQQQKKSQKDLEKSSFEVDLQKRFSLLLDSAIKQKREGKEQFKKKLQESDISEALYSISSLRDLSDLIKESRGGYEIEGVVE